MADRFPLIVNPVSRKIEEIVAGDNLNLTDNAISINGDTGSPGKFISSDGVKLEWKNETVTKIKGGNNGTYFSGDISLDEGDSGNVSIIQSGKSIKIDSKDTITKIRGTENGVYISGNITLSGAENTEITQAGSTIIIDFTQVKSDWNAINTVAEILNKPIIPETPSIQISNTPFGSGNLEYNANTGVFTYTPPDLSGLAVGGNEDNWNTAYSWGDHGIEGYLVATETDKNNWDTAYSWGDHGIEGYLVATEQDKNNWDTAYSWGDHGIEGYLTVEEDPIFTASAAYGITQIRINEWNEAYGWGNHANYGYLTSFTESDPVFAASVASGITQNNITDWNSAYSWGNHADAGYLANFTEEDPVFTASIASGIEESDITKWDTAYSWGNHANAGYLTSPTFPQRETASITTPIIANGAVSNIEIIVAKSYLLQKVQTSAASWITIYSDAASRTSDASRSEITDPQPGSGVIAEIITTGAFTQKITPGTVGWNDDATPSENVYLKIVNKSGSTQAITVTLTYVKLEG